MRRNKDVLKILLVALIAVFLMLGTAGVLVARHNKTVEKEQKKQAALEILESMPKLTPTPVVMATATPTPVPTATPTPTPVVAMPTFNPDEYWDNWYSTDGLAGINIYSISTKSVSFSFSQALNGEGTSVSEADVTAEIAGNAAQFSFTDSWGNSAGGNMIFDNGRLYVKIVTDARAEGAPVCPAVDCIMTRERNAVQQEITPEVTQAPVQTTEQSGEYFFPESSSRYLSDEEISVYSSSDLELAKNEIYARHGRQFVTERIANYFNSKSWYQGTIDPETFDSQQASIFNEYEIANIDKIAQWEEQKRNQGQ